MYLHCTGLDCAFNLAGFFFDFESSARWTKIIFSNMQFQLSNLILWQQPTILVGVQHLAEIKDLWLLCIVLHRILCLVHELELYCCNKRQKKSLHCKYIRCNFYSFKLCPTFHCNFTVWFTFNCCSKYNGIIVKLITVFLL